MSFYYIPELTGIHLLYFWVNLFSTYHVSYTVLETQGLLRRGPSPKKEYVYLKNYQKRKQEMSLSVSPEQGPLSH